MTKLPANWIPESSGSVVSTNDGVQRIEQDSTVRVLQDGTTRVLQPNLLTLKTPAVWVENN